MSGCTWPSSPGSGSRGVSIVVQAYAGDAAEANTKTLTPAMTATAAITRIGVRNRSMNDRSSYRRRE